MDQENFGEIELTDEELESISGTRGEERHNDWDDRWHHHERHHRGHWDRWHHWTWDGWYY